MLSKNVCIAQDIKLLNHINLEKYFIVKNRLENTEEYPILRALIFKVLGIFVMSFQMIEITIQGLLKMYDLLDEYGENIESEIINDFNNLLQKAVNEQMEVTKDHSNFQRLIELCKTKEIISSELFSNLDEYRGLRNDVVHSRLVTQPFLFYKKDNMKDFIMEMTYHTLRVAQYIELISDSFVEKYKLKYPNFTMFMAESIQKFNTLKEDLTRKNDYK